MLVSEVTLRICPFHIAVLINLSVPPLCPWLHLPLGEAEEEIRKVFRVARQASPCILFFDEIDALVTNRGIGTGGNNSAESRVLATFLTELDGIQTNTSMIFVMAATNRLESIDAALLRKGRFDHCLMVDIPSLADAKLLFEYFGAKYHLTADAVADLVEQHIRSDAVDAVDAAGQIDITGVSGDGFVKVNDASGGQGVEGKGSLSGAQIENLCKELALGGVRASIASGADLSAVTRMPE